MFGLPLDTWLRFGVWLVIGLLIYAFYGVRHSRVGGATAERVTRVALLAFPTAGDVIAGRNFGSRTS